MKILCKYSGIEFTCDHFPFALDSREVAHPVFSIRQDRLIALLARKYPDSLTPTDSYLGFLALLHSTGKIDWRVPCAYIPAMDAVIAANMQEAIRTIGIISAVTHPAFTYPGFVMTPDTRSLVTVHHWLAIWKQCYLDFCDGNKKAQLHDRIVRREQAMERLIKDPAKNPANYANQLAEWAALAGEFPIGTVPVGSEQISLADYWKGMIRKAAREEAIFSLNDTDLEELIEHCEESIPHGSIYAHTLMHVLRNAKERKKNFLGLGDFDIRTSTFRILDDADSAETANISAMVQSAPIKKPIESDYPSKIAYLRAHYKWMAAQTVERQKAADAMGNSAEENLKNLGE